MSVQVGLVGLGIGATHLKSLDRVPNARVAAIADLNLERAGEFAAPRGANAYRDWREMLEGEPALDAVILATPAAVRREPIAAICERKLALFCEKPPALDIDEARAIAGSIEAVGILNTVGFMYRWSPAAERLRALLEGRAKLFARIAVAWPVFSWVAEGKAPRSLYRKEACGGPLAEQAIHFIDLLRYVTQDEPIGARAMAELGSTAPAEGRDCEETTVYLLRHASGMLSANVHNWSHSGILLEVQVVGADFDLAWRLDRESLRVTGKIDGEPIEEPSEGDSYFREIAGFIEAVRCGDQSLLRSSYADAAQTLAVCAAAAEAVESGASVAVERIIELSSI